MVDGVLEDVRLGLELNIPKMNQRRVSTVKFLGELYNFQLIESNVVFRTLYMILSFGANPDGTSFFLLTHLDRYQNFDTYTVPMFLALIECYLVH